MNRNSSAGRLAALADMIPECRCIADIGCDHGLLGELALKSGKARYLIASDVSSLSLEKARNRFAGHPDVCLRAGYGLDVLKPYEADVICIAGMGAHTIAEILSDGEDVARSARYLLLGPHRNPENLRAFLYEHGYVILNERIVLDRGHFYPLILSSPAESHECVVPIHNLLGIGSVSDPVYRMFLEYTLARTERALSFAEKYGADTARARELKTLADEIAGLLAGSADA